jgi:leucyl-tRNA---protein transferase
MHSDAVFWDDLIDESIPMQPMHPAMFDDYLAEGWRLLGHSVVRHNFTMNRGKICRTIPLRIRLDAFRFSKSQRRLMRRNGDLELRYGPIGLTPEKETLFGLHADRFEEKRPQTLAAFLSHRPHEEPVSGVQFDLYDPRTGALAAFSFLHLGQKSVCSTYCSFHPAYHKNSLGAYTMLLEIEKALQLGKKFFYHGYCYDVPSTFDYKLNFQGLEAMDWKTGAWRAFG